MKTPVPFFRGATIVASASERMLHLARPSRAPFDEPAATTELLIPRATLVHVNPYGWPGCANGQLRFLGWFADVARRPLVTLGSFDATEAFEVAHQVQAMLGLPLRPVVCCADELDDRLPPLQYVSATGEYRETYGRPDFGRVRLSGLIWHETREKRRVPDGKYRVIGFYGRAQRGPGAAPIPGCGGPTLDVMEMMRA